MSNLTILLVDDNYGDTLLVVKALEASNRGTNLQIVSDGEEALSYLCKTGKYQNSPRPDLVMLDLNLPKKSGREVLSEIRKTPSFSEIPVVLVTGAKPTREMATLCALNPNFYIVKPEGIVSFFAMIRAIEEYGWNILRVPAGEKEYSSKLREVTAAA